MTINCGIIGLPNVGKSTFFKALTNMSVKIANFPFSTIQPNIASIQILDSRIYQLAEIIHSQKIICDTIEFIDIAGLIQGAHQGEGLGNQILRHVRTVKILIHVVRCFENNQITHVYNDINPYNDIKIINEELMLFDMLQCELNITRLRKKCTVINNYTTQQLLILKKCLHNLYNGVNLRMVKFSNMEKNYVESLNLLTFKPVIYIANINEETSSDISLRKLYNSTIFDKYVTVITCCARSPKNCFIRSNKNNYFNSYVSKIVLKDSKTEILNLIVNSIFSMLNLCTFFTININVAHTWINFFGISAVQAAKKVHSDFKNNFIRVQVIQFDDFISYKSEQKVRAAGKIRSEGKNYQILDGDILKFLYYKKNLRKKD